MDLTAFAIEALYDPRLAVGAHDAHVLLRVSASNLPEPGVSAALRLWTPLGANVATLRELSPLAQDLGDDAIRHDEHTTEYPAGRWTSGTRDYQVTVGLPACDAGDEMLATRVSILVDAVVVGRTSIVVTWTEDVGPIAAPNRAPATSTDTPAVADLPTDQSTGPRHTSAEEPNAARCPMCAWQARTGDRYCELCGYEFPGARSREA